MSIAEKKLGQPLSAAQLGIWFGQKLDPSTSVFNHGNYVDVRGSLDVALFEVALRQAFREADALSVRFLETEHAGDPRQVIDPSLEASLSLIDLTGRIDPEKAADAVMKADMCLTVGLARGPLFNFILFKIAADRFFWYLRFHHIINDGFGACLFMSRVAEVYTAYAHRLLDTGEQLKPLNFLLEQDRDYRVSNKFKEDRQYWINRFADKPVPLSLSNSRIIESAVPLRETAHLPPLNRGAIASIAQRMGTRWSRIIAALAIAYLSRMTSSDEVTIGLPITTRLNAAEKHVVGMAANILPLRLPVPPSMTFSAARSRCCK